MTDEKAMVVKGYYDDQTMSLERLKGHIQIIKDVMKSVMVENEHYGTIPGCGPKPALHKPGAEKLCVTFRLAPSYIFTKTDLPNNHREYEFICTLTHIPTGAVIGQGVGSCSTMESRYRYRKAEQVCPICGKEAIIKGKKEYGGGWLCFGKKGGCGAKFTDGDPEIENQNMGRVEHPDPADNYNTVLKMGKKRSMTDAILTATAASDIFMSGDDDEPPSKPGDPPPPKTKKDPKPELPSAADYKRLYAAGEMQENPVSKDEIKKIAEWYRNGEHLTKAELDAMIKNFNRIFDKYLSSLKEAN